ncbi:putative membrane protein [Desulfitobacterium dichloroeliminans LMG P-21439]|uniref:Putative membrane protein n=1 Tax=Desulfitobacterium dichloroeliminans (strain LMG P-21439 / DCA1) TaxID=871963 RepID=L0F9T0_DESDL|nr:DUF421 domain-containing protein [Desulfitobacterium dichloroeliminans]AGA69703.1 putative membrane protein [Desulfitobacterium dichloroeliminans LMG P-21439]
MMIIAIRTFILYMIVIMALRLMGKREIGQLQPFELVVILMISDMAAIPSEDIGIPLISGIIPIMILVLMSVALSYLELKSERARDILNGTPSILIERGKIVEHELVRNRLPLTDLIEELRMRSIPNIADVEFAILETNGQISVLPKATKRPVTPGDLKLQPEYEGLPVVFIMDGLLNKRAFALSGKDQTWLDRELQKHQLKGIEEVLFASLDSSGQLYLQEKKRTHRKNNGK